MRFLSNHIRVGCASLIETGKGETLLFIIEEDQWNFNVLVRPWIAVDLPVDHDDLEALVVRRHRPEYVRLKSRQIGTAELINTNTTFCIMQYTGFPAFQANEISRYFPDFFLMNFLKVPGFLTYFQFESIFDATGEDSSATRIIILTYFQF